MKEKLYILLVVIASSFLAGCSNDSDSLSIKGESLSETPILLQSDSKFFSVNTRASIDAIESIDTLGMFCVAREKTGVHGSDEAQDVNWMQVLENTTENYGFTTNGIYWENLKFTPAATEDGRTELKAYEGEEYVGYFPITNWYGYDFYTYYPYKEEYVQASDSLAVDFTIDGTVDVIWGRSTKVADPYAYSSRYVKAMNIKKIPMTLNHCTTQFRFFLLPAEMREDSVVDPDKVQNLSLKEIKMLDESPNVRMTLASINNDECVGTIYPNGEETTDFILMDKDGNAVSENPVPVPYKEVDGKIYADTARIGDCIMVCPGKTEYFMSMCMCDSDNPENEYRSEKRISIKASDNSAFKPGYIYNIYITINGVSFVSMDATLQEWTNAEDDPSLKFEIY